MESNRKELINEYKNRKSVGGVCMITNLTNNKMLIYEAPDLHGAKNRFEMAKKMGGGSLNLKISADWDKLGPESFSFRVLEELEKKDEQSPAEFKNELKLLKELWQEKLSGEFY